MFELLEEIKQPKYWQRVYRMELVVGCEFISTSYTSNSPGLEIVPENHGTVQF